MLYVQRVVNKQFTQSGPRKKYIYTKIKQTLRKPKGWRINLKGTLTHFYAICGLRSYLSSLEGL